MTVNNLDVELTGIGMFEDHTGSDGGLTLRPSRRQTNSLLEERG